MIKVLVTGGAGFIGSHIVDRLVKEGHQVLVVDNLSTGHRINLNPSAEFVKLDIQDDALADTFNRFGPEVVIHHAAQVAVTHSIRHPLYDARVNIMGTLNVLEACHKSGVRKLIYASSAAVYGLPESDMLKETHAIKPLSFYGISKHTPEHYIETYARLIGLDFTILRYANVYGGRQDAKGEGGVVSIFASKLLNNERCAIFGDGEQTRDFIYVKDIVSANISALTRGSGKIMNISGGSATSINQLLRTMCDITGKRFAPVYMAPRTGDIKDSVLDNRLAVKELGWSPEYTLHDGLLETLDFEKQSRTKVEKGVS
ncbi:NAD-dependent epimerase/dehydratase family protein [Paenibacillus sp. MMO-177]|uniref:NAD-dependent epimerase/dehydratase family protein n=1 Tax=Paenibacillus sp. MMO-177 TaxID=3081289 RepID=UPI0030199A8C